jgi:hypothetical protein
VRKNAGRARDAASASDNVKTMKTATVTLWLRVENNNKFVRGKTRAWQNIGNYRLTRSGMKKLEGRGYELTFS